MKKESNPPPGFAKPAPDPPKLLTGPTSTIESNRQAIAEKYGIEFDDEAVVHYGRSRWGGVPSKIWFGDKLVWEKGKE